MKINLLALLLISGMLSISCTKSKTETFTVSGRKLLDANGNEFRILGVNNPHAWYPQKAYNALPTIASLNNNTIRVVWQMHGRIELLDSVLTKCTELNMVPMIELHDATGDSTRTKLLELAQYYTRPEVKHVLDKYKRYLLINIANEWGNHFVTPEYWRDSYIQAVNLLREAGYKATIVIDAPGWGQDIEPITKYAHDVTASDSLKNILYSVHLYGNWNNADSLKMLLQNVYDKEIPLVIGEFGYNYQDGKNNLKCKVDHIAVLEICHELGFGLMPWSWAGNTEGNEWLDLVKTEDWKTFTWWGEQVYNNKYGIKQNAKMATVFRDCYK